MQKRHDYVKIHHLRAQEQAFPAGQGHSGAPARSLDMEKARDMKKARQAAGL
jgi:hypothetical protein